MRRSILIFILGVGATLLAFYVVERVRSNAVRVPPWHPFEVRSDLRLDDLVADGYRFWDMPCGMVHFSKTIGDTTIRYGINISCETYEGKYVREPLELSDYLEDSVEPSDSAAAEEEATRSAKLWELQRLREPYWPFDPDSVRNCYQTNTWRHYWFTMETIDSLAIRQFVENHGGFLFAEHWNSTTGGEFMVGTTTNHLTFSCSIERDHDHEGNYLPWEFVMITKIPFLDQARYEEDLERDRRRAAFYDPGEVSWPVIDTLE
jgi:hypothetical protein